MNLLWLFLEFFKIGICAFGGGLATIPFLEELSKTRGWFTLDQLADMIAISESTPGAIGINMSTYVGYIVGTASFNGNFFIGFVGGIIATLGFVTPSIIVILIICQFLKKFSESKVVKWAFYGLRAASFGLICNAAYSILKISIINIDSFDKVSKENFWPSLGEAMLNFFDYKCLILAGIMAFLIFKFKKHPIIYIVIAAIIGIIFKF
jgi:chromate transporter